MRKRLKQSNMHKITADYIFTAQAQLATEQVLTLDPNGKIIQIDALSNHDAAEVYKYKGVLVPGFVNTHCHLELSHMLGKVDTGTQLIPFISNVVQYRDLPEDVILEAINKADQEMYEAGIVAVGDICNKLDTAARKNASPIRYYSFVEMFDFLQDANAQQTFDGYLEVYKGQARDNNNKCSAVPHAPYSVSASLFDKINQLNQGKGTVSIHNQETPPENELFEHKTGDFISFYEGFNIPLDEFKATGQASIYYALTHMDPNCRHLFVHNTLTTPADIAAAHAWGKNGIYWATCANANLYIENRLPNYQYFIDANAKMTIGTDSLTSNWQLSVLEELKTISKYQSYVPLTTLLTWATINGAEALQFDDELGSFEVGKTPAVLLLSDLNGDKADKLTITQQTKVKRLF